FKTGALNHSATLPKRVTASARRYTVYARVGKSGLPSPNGPERSFNRGRPQGQILLNNPVDILANTWLFVRGPAFVRVKSSRKSKEIGKTEGHRCQ
ncbi:MAG: hypothetical protein ACLQFW_16180, partial [Xanthobacteraceae bacterium]